MINYQAIIENLREKDIINLMERLGSECIQDKPEYLVFKTICHNEDADEASAKLYYWKNTHYFYCFTECGPISVFNLLEHYYNTRNIKFNWYDDILRKVLDCSNYIDDFNDLDSYESIKNKYIREDTKELPVYDSIILDSFVKFYPKIWLNDGITKEAMDKFNIRFSILQNKIIIPHYNANGGLVGIRSRLLNEEELATYGKYMPVFINKHLYSHPLSLNVYGLYENKENIKKHKICYVFEAE